jgi:hypothetical protein
MTPTARGAVLAVVLLLVGALAAIVSSDGGAPPQKPARPGLAHQVGAFGVRARDASAAAHAGITAAITDYPSSSTAGAVVLRNARVSVIDKTIESILYAHVPRSCATSVAPCPIAETEITATLDQVRAHLEKVGSDPSVMAFYVLDDYPGSINPLLARVHAVIAAANRKRRLGRPTVCGFSADLDFTGGDTVVQPRDTMRRALANYSPAACDAVLMYSYAHSSGDQGSVDASAFDWTMARVLPDFLQELRGRGWTPRSPLIGTPMAFDSPSTGYSGPTSTQLATQVEAFCAAGVTAVIAFAWHVADRPASSLATDPQLRAGLRAGVPACQARWRAPAKTAAVPVTTPTPRATPPMTSVG